MPERLGCRLHFVPKDTADLGAKRSDRLVTYVFDVLYVDGFDVRQAPLFDRRRILSQLLDGADERIRCSEYIEGDGRAIFKNACEIGIEGIVSKRRDSRYQSGRTIGWIKATCRKRDPFWVAGIAFKAGKFDGLYLARREVSGLAYAGKVERGFDDKAARKIVSELLPLKVGKTPLSKKMRKPKATWVKPIVPVDVEYRALTGDGLLRHPSFKGIRRDAVAAPGQAVASRPPGLASLPRNAALKVPLHPRGFDGGRSAFTFHGVVFLQYLIDPIKQLIQFGESRARLLFGFLDFTADARPAFRDDNMRRPIVGCALWTQMHCWPLRPQYQCETGTTGARLSSPVT